MLRRDAKRRDERWDTIVETKTRDFGDRESDEGFCTVLKTGLHAGVMLEIMFRRLKILVWAAAVALSSFVASIKAKSGC